LSARLKKKFDLTVEDIKDDETEVFAYLGVEFTVDKNTNDGSHLQQNQATSPLKSHIMIKSYSRGLQWDFC